MKCKLGCFGKFRPHKKKKNFLEIMSPNCFLAIYFVYIFALIYVDQYL